MANSQYVAPYARTFERYVQQGVALMLERVRQTPNLLPDELRIQALHTLSFAFQLPAAWPLTRDLLLLMAPKMEQAGHREDWMPYLETGLSYSQVQDQMDAAAEFQLQIGILHRLLGKFAPAHDRLDASLLIYSTISNRPGQARVLNELAWLSHLQQHYEDAIQHVEAALALLNDNVHECGMSYRVLGMIAFCQGHLVEAEAHHRQSLRLFRQQNDKRREAWALQNIALALREQKKTEEAITYFQQSAMILREIQDKYHWGIVEMNLGVSYLAVQQPELALSCFINTELIARTLHDTLQLARSQNNLGLAFLALAKYTEAEIAFLSARELFGKLGDEGWQLNELDGLAMVYIAQKQYSKAIALLDEALVALPRIKGTSNHQYLSQSLQSHLHEAKYGLSLLLHTRPP